MQITKRVVLGYVQKTLPKDILININVPPIPLDRIRELAQQGVIGSVADFHYSFMGATAPQQMETAARTLAGLLKKDSVTAVLLTPV